jgi:ParB family chromosome partitioning protein
MQYHDAGKPLSDDGRRRFRRAGREHPRSRAGRIESIDVGANRRKLDESRAQALADSIAQVGLQNPVGLTNGNRLIHGRHRLRACEILGWKKIPAIIHPLDKLHAELAEIDENLIRSDLTAAEQTKALARRKEIYEALHPETKHGGDRKIKTSSGKDCHLNFAADTAEKTGRSERSIRMDTAIGKGLSDAVVPKLAETPIADNKRELAKLAKYDEAEQAEIVDALKDGSIESVAEWDTPQIVDTSKSKAIDLAYKKENRRTSHQPSHLRASDHRPGPGRLRAGRIETVLNLA